MKRGFPTSLVVIALVTACGTSQSAPVPTATPTTSHSNAGVTNRPSASSNAPQFLPGTILTVAGNGVQGDAGDGGQANAAQLNSPKAVAVDAIGNVYIGEAVGRVRMVTVDGTIRTVAGTGTPGFSGDGGPAIAAQLTSVVGLAVDEQGDLYIADGFNHRVRMVAPNGTITTVAGTGDPGPEGFGGYSGDGGPATLARLGIPNGLALDPQGDLYIADGNNNRVREVSRDGAIHTVLGPSMGLPNQYLDPAGISFDKAGNLYVADNGELLIWKVVADGTISKLAGRGIPAGDSPNCTSALQAAFGQSLSVAVDERGNVYFADAAHDKVREVSPDGTFRTIAGNGTHGYFGSGGPSGDGGQATEAALGSPPSVALDSKGDLYVADEANMRVRKVIAPWMTRNTCG